MFRSIWYTTLLVSLDNEFDIATDDEDVGIVVGGSGPILRPGTSF